LAPWRPANAQAVPGDVDGDGIPGEFPDDFAPIRNHFRQTVTMRSEGDLTSDSFVDFHDFRQWKAAFLGGVQPAAQGLPEPSTLVSAGLAFAAAAATRRRRS
jgi:hypothetical protein